MDTTQDRNLKVYGNDKPHKFFEKYLDNDLEVLTKQLERRYNLIENVKLKGIKKFGDVEEHFVESNSISTIKWREYNVFQFHIKEIYNLYRSVSELVKEACEYYEIDFDSQNFMIQGWFNINTSGKGKLNWHDHGEPGAPNFHGYYCVNAEPSVTYYKINGNTQVENVNKNNRVIVSEMGHPHAQGDWDWDGPRITVAYDIIPLRKLPITPETEQHWIPLL